MEAMDSMDSTVRFDLVEASIKPLSHAANVDSLIY